MNRTCFRCPSTATHFPRVIHSNGGAQQKTLVNKPVCVEHCSPIAESVASPAGMRELEECFLKMMSVPHNPRLTRVEYLPATHDEVVTWQEFLRTKGEINQSNAIVIPIEAVDERDLAELTATLGAVPTTYK